MSSKAFRTLAVMVAVLTSSAAQWLSAADPATEPPAVDPALAKFFENEVRPLLVGRCFKCHSADRQKGDLRLDTLGAMLSGGESGPAIVRGKPAESLLVEAINYASYEMPPTGKLPENEIAILTRWVELGAPWPNADLTVRPKANKEKITAEDRAFWRYQPLERPAVPEVNDDWARNEVDRFILARLDSANLEPAPEADRLTLLRRAYFDLIGLPPSSAEVSAFLADERPDAYEQMIDRLLESPRYGERWARHWLDLVRYADSDGFNQDAYRPHAWRFRDYVIRSFNDDKPYDRFVTEQLAGDELFPDDPEALVATGYLRHWQYEYNQRDARTQWSDILNDVTDVTAEVFLGMSIGCARCHDHKFDPILQRDYFRLQAFFTPILPREDRYYATPSELQTYEAKLAAWQQETAEVRRELNEMKAPILAKAAEEQITKFPADVEAMMRKAPEDRAPYEQQLAELAWRQVIDGQKKAKFNFKGDKAKRYDELTKQLAEFEKHKPPRPPVVVCVTDVGREPPPTFIPGDRNQEPIEPGYLTLLSPEPARIDRVETAPDSSGRRTALARWITRPDNPLSNRVIANRIWQYHFGTGLVATSSDFGRLGEKPSHPQLLDWLATEFVRRGWSFKQMHKLLMTSATYRQSALRPTPAVAMQSDPGNRLLWKMNLRRLDAEQIRDALLAATGELSDKMYGAATSASEPRRSLYTKQIRNTRDPLLQAFDAPPGFTSTALRNVTTTATQSLLMVNSGELLKRATALTNRAKQESGGNVEKFIQAAYRRTLSRDPESVEMALARTFIEEQAKRIAGESPDSGPRIPVEQFVEAGRKAAVVRAEKMKHRLRVPDTPQLPSGDFTIEAVVRLDSLYEDATVRTIASQWDSNNRNPGWSFGVTSKKSKYTPQNLILQLVGNSAEGGAGYEVVASGLHVELGKPYYVAVSVTIDDTSEQGITFYAKDLTGDAQLQVARVPHRVTGQYRARVALEIGGRDQQKRHFWDGLIDEVRLSSAALPEDQLLLAAAPSGDEDQPSEPIVGHWRFEEPGVFRDSSGSGHHLQLETANAARDQALIDFCHVLLNTNEFVYVD